MTKVSLDNQYFIAPMAEVIEKETKKAVDIKSERKNRRQNFVEVAYSTGAPSASSGDRSATDISDEQMIKEAY